MAKRFLRSKDNRIIGGVCGGLGEYLDIDPVIIRIVWLVLFFAGGVGFLAYLVAWIIVPEENDSPYPDQEEKKTETKPRDDRGGKLIGGIILIVIGVLFILDKQWYFNDLIENTIRMIWKYFLPAIFIGIGIYLISKSKKEKTESGTKDFTKQEKKQD
ncbi:MAG: PspC domain-containing protein [Candidatus Marinimicrobia bacterium]|nr:PspC domain-containing protein [Candidatus Neomarinimicrobiota bacterium]